MNIMTYLRYHKEYTKNPIKWLYWWFMWGSISCVYCRNKLARVRTHHIYPANRACCSCAIEVKENHTKITQRLPHPWYWGNKLKNIWY